MKVARSEEELLNDKETNMVCGAAITNERCALGLRAMQAGKDYFTDKAPFTTLEQLDSAKKMAAQTGKKYMVYYGERLHVEGAVLAGNLIEQGAIGKVIHVEGFGPHRLGAAGRPRGSLKRRSTAASSAISAATKSSSTCSMPGEEDGTVSRSRIANYAHPQYPELDDFGDCAINGANGTTFYFRVDWFTPDGLRTWGDGRTIIIGTKGYIEIRKYVDVGTERDGGNHVFLCQRPKASSTSTQPA